MKDLKPWEKADPATLESIFRGVVMNVAAMDYQLNSLLASTDLEVVWKEQIALALKKAHNILRILEGRGFPCSEILREYQENIEHSREFTPLDPQLEQEIIKRMDVQAEYEGIGFRPLPGAVPDKNGWLPGESMHEKGGLGFINVGDGPERGLYIEYLLGDFPQESPSDH